MYEIEKNVPLPNPQVGRGKIYPFNDMEVGDSVFIADKEPKTVSRSAYVYGKESGYKFAVRQEGDGTRIWRVE